MSVIDWNSIKPSFNFVGWENYQRIFTSFRFQSSMRNMLFFSIFFIAGVVISGLSLAIFLDRKVRGKWIYRNIFLFPMALSFVVTGIAWRWILNPAAGVNIFLEKIGISPQWYTDTAILFGFDLDQIEMGIPIALFSVILAAIWQMTGFSLAMYLAGLASIPKEMKEAAIIDGANSWQIYTRVVLPQLKPITFGLVLIMLQISLKNFDLVYTMTGSGPNFVTDTPAIYMYEATFKSNFYAEGAAVAIVLLVVVMMFVLPAKLREGRNQ